MKVKQLLLLYYKTCLCSHNMKNNVKIGKFTRNMDLELLWMTKKANPLHLILSFEECRQFTSDSIDTNMGVDIHNELTFLVYRTRRKAAFFQLHRSQKDLPHV